jgi:hypothetical protein
MEGFVWMNNGGVKMTRTSLVLKEESKRVLEIRRTTRRSASRIAASSKHERCFENLI